MTDRMHDETAEPTNDTVDEEPYLDAAEDEEDEQRNEAIAAEDAAREATPEVFAIKALSELR